MGCAASAAAAPDQPASPLILDPAPRGRQFRQQQQNQKPAVSTEVPLLPWLGDSSSIDEQPNELTEGSSRLELASAPVDVACAILAHCGWSDRAALAALNQHWHGHIFANGGTWKAMCGFLHTEEHVYSAPTVCLSCSWKSLFSNLWPLRKRWVKSTDAEKSKVAYSAAELLARQRDGETGLIVEPGWKKKRDIHEFNISVVVRLRPYQGQGDKLDGEDGVESVESVVLPLHQRIALIRSQTGCSKAEAFERLFATEKKTDFFEGSTLQEADFDSARLESAATETVAATGAAGQDKILPPLEGSGPGFVSATDREVTICAPGVGLRPFTCFDAVLADSASQVAVYETVARRQVADFINGLNCTIFCYGQTGSGKTHTLFGSDTCAATAVSKTTAEAGIVPRACSEVMAAVGVRKLSMEHCTLQVSYIEVYGEDISDLLQQQTTGDDEKKTVGAWRGTAVRAVLDGATRITVNDAEHLQCLLLQGEGAKRRAATAMNARSSRAHALLILTLTQSANGVEANSHLVLADLGGSEQLSKSGATGVRMQEAIGINTGLLALKQCIRALNNRASHVPYNDSKLTALLSSALGGDSKTTVVITASQDPRHASESLQALRFGEACAVVTNAATVQQSSIAQQIAELDAKIVAAEKIIEQKERWERWEEKMPVDEFGDGGGIRTRMRLVGAEDERKDLEDCLRKRRALLGEPEPEKTAGPDQQSGDAQNGDANPERKECASNMETIDRTSDEGCAAFSGADCAGSEEETGRQKQLRLKAEAREAKLKARFEKAQKAKEERRAQLLAKAAERERRAEQRKADMLDAAKATARKQQERIKKQQMLKRKALIGERGVELETELAKVETELTESIRSCGIDSAASVEWAQKAEQLRKEIKECQGEKGLLQLLPAVDSATATESSGPDGLSALEQALIEAHKRDQVLVSDQVRAGGRIFGTNNGRPSIAAGACTGVENEINVVPAPMKEPHKAECIS
eukprot:SAG31_NODE_97_length_25714_cov_19.477142_2_plen_984_part_00